MRRRDWGGGRGLIPRVANVVLHLLGILLQLLVEQRPVPPPVVVALRDFDQLPLAQRERYLIVSLQVLRQAHPAGARGDTDALGHALPEGVDGPGACMYDLNPGDQGLQMRIGHNIGLQAPISTL